MRVVGLNYYNDPFIEYASDMDVIYENIDEKNPN